MENRYDGQISDDDMFRLKRAMVREYGHSGIIAPRVLLCRLAARKKLTARRMLAIVIHHERQIEKYEGVVQ